MVVCGLGRSAHCGRSYCGYFQPNMLVALLVCHSMPWASVEAAAREGLGHSRAVQSLVGHRAGEAGPVMVICGRIEVDV